LDPLPPLPPELPEPPELCAPERAIAVDVSEVDNSSVIAGGVTAANFPQLFRNSRRSSSSVEDMDQPLILELASLNHLSRIKYIKPFNKVQSRIVTKPVSTWDTVVVGRVPSRNALQLASYLVPVSPIGAEPTSGRLSGGTIQRGSPWTEHSASLLG
jgi:hypothetical protein